MQIRQELFENNTIKMAEYFCVEHKLWLLTE